MAVLREAMRSLGAHGIPSRDSVARMTGLSSAGTSLSAIANALEAFGVDVRRLNGRGREWPTAPFVAHLSVGHFVLVRDVRAWHVRVFDPLVGEVLMRTSTFDALWSGAAFALASAREPDDMNAPH